jgi:GntR family transcriptional regulator / MocR family aminotransferase
MDIGPPLFFQEVLADFIGEGHFARHIRRMRGVYSERRSLLADYLTRELGSSIEILGGEAGMHLTITFHDGSRDLEIAERAALQNLWTWPLSPYYLREPKQGLVLGYASTTVAEIPRAVRRLRDVIAASSCK